jgi:hypothetical protein
MGKPRRGDAMNERRPGGGIRYPGDDGSEPEHVRDAKAKKYADEVTARAMRHAAKDRPVKSWRNLWGILK